MAFANQSIWTSIDFCSTRLRSDDDSRVNSSGRREFGFVKKLFATSDSVGTSRDRFDELSFSESDSDLLPVKMKAFLASGRYLIGIFWRRISLKNVITLDGKVVHAQNNVKFIVSKHG